jgi:hypothetical protein
MAKVALPEADVDAIRRFAADRSAEWRDLARLEVEVRGRSVTIVEFEKPWFPEAGPDWLRRRVAQLRYDPETRLWSLYCTDRNERLWFYDEVHPTRRVARLIDEIATDPTGIFWG